MAKYITLFVTSLYGLFLFPCDGLFADDTGTHWPSTTLKCLDPWGDAACQSCDIIAGYCRSAADSFLFRIDFLDLEVDSIPCTVLLIDNKPGGENQVRLENSNVTVDLHWDYMVKIDQQGQFLDYRYEDKSDSLWDFAFDTRHDYIFAAVPAQLFIPQDERMTLQALVFRGDAVLDKTRAFTTQDSTGRAKLVLSFMNAFIGYGPHAVSWYDGYAQQYKNRPRMRGGFRYLLDAVEKYRLPLTINDVRFEQLPGNEYLGINKRFRYLSSQDLLDPLSTLNYGYFMCWQSGRVHDKTIRLLRRLRANMDIPLSEVFYPYEAMLRYSDVKKIKNAGFRAIYGLDRFLYWFGPVTDWGDTDSVRAKVESSKKIHRIGDMDFFFLPVYRGFAWDPRWGDLDWGLDMWDGTDGGLFLWLRRILHDMAMDPDQEKVFTLGTDLNLTSWLYSDDLERDMSWIAAHPWIEVTTFSDILDRGWTPIVHESGDDPQAPLEKYRIENDGHYNAYFWQYYDGGVSDGHSPVVPAGARIEAYRDFVPFLRDGQKIATAMPMGDESTGGSMIKNTMDGLLSCPDNELTTLAWLSCLNAIAEQTLHAGRFYGGHEAAGGDFGGQFLHPAAKFRANDLRQVNKLLAAALWVQDVVGGRMNEKSLVEERDLDLDEENEYVMKNDRIFLIFENDGGRLEYAFSFHPDLGAVQHIAPVYQQMVTSDGWGWNYTMGEIATAPTWNQQADAAFVDDLDGDWQFDYPVYEVSLDNNRLVLTAPDCVLVKTIRLDGDQVIADYRVKNAGTAGFGIGLVVNMLNIFNKDWADGVTVTQKDKMVRMDCTAGGGCLIDFSDPAVYLASLTSFKDSPAREEGRERDSYDDYPSGHWLYYPYVTTSFSGDGAFVVKLVLSAKLAETKTAKNDAKIVDGFDVLQNYPNPFNPATTIVYSLHKSTRTRICIFTLTGDLVRTLSDCHQMAGRHFVRWDGTGEQGLRLSSGVYFCRIQADGKSRTIKLMLLK